MGKKSSAVKYLEKLAGGRLTFGRLIQSIRLGEEESLASFAEKLMVSRQNLSDIEHGRRGVSVERAAQWAQLLGYAPEQFVELGMTRVFRSARWASPDFLDRFVKLLWPRAAAAASHLA